MNLTVAIPTEADMCRMFVVPKLQAAEWNDEPRSIAEQWMTSPGRIVVRSRKTICQKIKQTVITQQQAKRGIDFQSVALQAGKPDADPFDLLCHLAFNAPLLTRRQRADRVKRKETAFFNYLALEAREILEALLEKYATDGELQFTLPDVLKVPPISKHGNANEIAAKFGGAEKLRTAVNKLQTLLYAA